MSTYTQDWDRRYEDMGDMAEFAFETTQKRGARGFARFGLNRPVFDIGGLPLRIRYMPDYLQSDRLVECKGVGRDNVLKVKDQQLFWLKVWNTNFPVHVFIYNSYTRTYTWATIDELWAWCHAQAEPHTFPEGKPAWFLPLQNVSLVWRSIDT